MPYLKQIETISRVTLPGPLSTRDREILTPEAIEFLAALHSAFEDRRRKLVARRSVVQHEIDIGVLPDFSRAVRGGGEGLWRVRPAPAGLTDRRAEIAAPAADAGGLIDAANSGAPVFVADLEDSHVPTWSGTLDAHRNIRNAAQHELACIDPHGRRHTLESSAATLMVRPRGWHLTERHFCVDGDPISASLFDAGLFLLHGARALLEGGSAPCFSLPKLENRFEAAFWADVFSFAEERLRLPSTSIRATVLLESVLAVFELEPILHSLRERAAGVAFGTDDYLSSLVRKFHAHPALALRELPGEGEDPAFLHAARLHLIGVCRRRGTQAIAGGSPASPSGGPGSASTGRALDSVRRRGLLDALAGFDGTAVAHHSLVPEAMAAFDGGSRAPGTEAARRITTDVGREDLLAIGPGGITGEGLIGEISTALTYIESWLSGAGAVVIDGRLADASTAELSRGLVRTWLHHGIPVDGGAALTGPAFRRAFTAAADRIARAAGPERYRRGQYELASRLLFNLTHEREFTPYFTVKAAQYL